jgi:hypothetical protein
MCSPTAVIAVTTLVSTAMTATAQKRQGEFQKGVSRYNARVAENQAQDVRRAGVEEENIQRRRTAELLSKQRAQLGAAGVELGTGSALQLQEDTVTLGEADALRIRSNVEGQVGALQTGAALTRQTGEFAEQAGRAQAAGTILGGTAAALDTGVSDKWFTPNSAAVTRGVNLNFAPTAADVRL